MSRTPTTESVRCAFIADGGWTPEDRAAMFDIWLDEQLGGAFADGQHSVFHEDELYGEPRKLVHPPNPYRSQP